MQCRIEINQAACLGSGRCVASHSDLFDLGENRKARVIVAQTDLTPEIADEIMNGCPAGVIEITFD